MRKLSIKPHQKVSELQEQFNKMYSMLAIKLYKKPHEDLEGSPLSEEIEEDYQLISINPTISAMDIDVSADQTVSEVEQQFENKGGLHVQVCRKSGNAWLQTSATDHWPLSTHQKHAEEMEEFKPVLCNSKSIPY